MTTGPWNNTLVPGQGDALGEAVSSAGAYCRFTIQGSKKTIRAVAVYDNGTKYTIAIPAQ